MSESIDGRILRRPTLTAYTGCFCLSAWRTAALQALAVWAFIVFAPGASAQNPSNDDSPEALQAANPRGEQFGPIVRAGEHGLKTFLWDFSRANDTDFNGRPDGWERRQGRRYPQYLDIEITSHDPSLSAAATKFDSAVIPVWQSLRRAQPTLPDLPPSLCDIVDDRYLRVELNGGLAMVQSSPIPSNVSYQYRLTCRVRTSRLVHDTAAVQLVFQDADDKTVATHTSRRIGGTTDWATVELNNVHPPKTATKMIVRVRVDADDDGLEDLRGVIGFDDILVEQFPQLLVDTDEPFGVYDVGTAVVARASVLGLPAEGPVVQFELFDAAGERLSYNRMPVKFPKAPEIQLVKKDNADPQATLRWRLPRLGPGYYRVTAALDQANGRSLATETAFVVLDSISDDVLGGKFGWSLPGGLSNPTAELPESRRLPKWLTKLGVRWVKLPCWMDANDSQSVEEAATFFSRLDENDVQAIGMLPAPPENLRNDFDLRGPSEAVAARVFRDYDIWHPTLEPIMTRLTLKVRQWQLGGDHDTSFLGRPRLGEQISSIARGLQGYGQELDIAISWPWIEPLVPSEQTTWSVTNRTTDQPLTFEELDAALTRQKMKKESKLASARNQQRVWLVQDPIAKGAYSLDDRVIDLMMRMAVVQSQRVEASFVSNPHDPDHGLLESNGRPKPILLPWRTTSMLIGNLRRIGSLDLRSGARNIVFGNDKRVVMMVWSDSEVEEEMYLGEEVAVVDAWGKKIALKEQIDPYGEPFQKFSVSRVPRFVVGIDPLLMKLRMSVEMKTIQLDSILSKPQDLTIQFANPLLESLSGQVSIRPPKSWEITRQERPWELPPRRAMQETFGVTLGNSATIGDYELPFTFEVERNTTKRVTVYRNVTLGPEGLELTSKSRFLPNGDLLVQIDMQNSSPTVMAFDCKLYPGKGRQYESQFLTVRPSTTASRRFVIRKARDLAGQEMRLKASELDGPRVLNYIFKVAD